MKTERKGTRTGQTGKPTLEVDGVKYVSSAYAQRIFNLAKSTFSKKCTASGIGGRRLDNTNTRYFTLAEAETIAGTGYYLSNRRKTNAEHLKIIDGNLSRISGRLEKLTTDKDFHLSSICARIVDDINGAKSRVYEALEYLEKTEPPRNRKRGRKPKNPPTTQTEN